jgi:hypothetical protein
MDKLTKKLQVLLTEDEVAMINRIILSDAVENEIRPISTSAFIRDLIRLEIDKRADTIKNWNKNNVKNLKDK